MKYKPKGFRTIGLIIVILIVFVVIYNVYDNNRVTVVRQEVEIDNLPDSFDGFIILQITDLHGKRFGRNQKRLVSKINSCEYDMIAISGDMINSYGDCDVRPGINLETGRNGELIGMELLNAPRLLKDVLKPMEQRRAPFP